MLTKLYTPSDLAERWSCHPRHLANLRCAGRGPAYVKLGGRVLYRVADIEAFEDARVVETVAA